MTLTVSARNRTTGEGDVLGLQDAIGGRLGLGEQVVGDRQAEEQFVGLRGLLGRLARREPDEPIQPLLLDLEELAVVVLVDRLECLAGRGGRGCPGTSDAGAVPTPCCWAMATPRQRNSERLAPTIRAIRGEVIVDEVLAGKRVRPG